MKDLDLQACLEFQEIFRSDAGYSPFEAVSRAEFYPLAIVGEIGSLLNAYCKKPRSTNDYDAEVEDEAGDILIYLLMFLLATPIDAAELFGQLDRDWLVAADPIGDDRALLELAAKLVECVRLLGLEDGDAWTPAHMATVLRLLKAVACYCTGSGWQELINRSHDRLFAQFTKPANYTADLYYRATGYIDFSALLGWADRYDLPLLPKRRMFLERMTILQRSQAGARDSGSTIPRGNG
jgi:hypothetical protein